ncbi:MAG: YciI family protein [Saprospiraceae bacterium]
MKKTLEKLLVVTLAIAFIAACNTSEPESKVQEKISEMAEEAEAVQYDSALAAKYGADAYGMKKYVMAFLKRGPNRDRDSAEAAALQRAHMENINRMAEEGTLIVAGPFFGNDDLRGIYIFDVRSIEEAEALTNTDPAIKAGSLEMELKEWYGPAALMAIADLHEKLTKKDIVE